MSEHTAGNRIANAYDRLESEVGRLRAINADLLEALEFIRRTRAPKNLRQHELYHAQAQVQRCPWCKGDAALLKAQG
jgi:hypothetical protein